MGKVCEIVATIDFVADINESKDCIMSQDKTQDDPASLWFNIDLCKGHDLKAGDRVKVTVERKSDPFDLDAVF